MRIYISQQYTSFIRKCFQRALIILSIISMLSVPFSYASAALSCTVTTSAACTGTIILRMSNTTNAHAELPSQSNLSYENSVVCCASSSSISNSCSGNFKSVARLSGTTNAHVQESSINTYGTNLCLSDATAGDIVTIGYQNANCTGYDTTLFSISSSTNGSVGDTNAYTRKVCGSISNGTPPPPVVSTSSSGGNGGSYGFVSHTIFTGTAPVESIVSVIKNGEIKQTVTTDATGHFSIKLSEMYNPPYELIMTFNSQHYVLSTAAATTTKKGYITEVRDIIYVPPQVVIEESTLTTESSTISSNTSSFNSQTSDNANENRDGSSASTFLETKDNPPLSMNPVVDNIKNMKSIVIPRVPEPIKILFIDIAGLLVLFILLLVFKKKI